MSVNRGESHLSAAPKKIAGDHFIRENVILFRQEARKSGSFFKKGAFFTVSRLRSENAVLGGIANLVDNLIETYRLLSRFQHDPIDIPSQMIFVRYGCCRKIPKAHLL